MEIQSLKDGQQRSEQSLNEIKEKLNEKKMEVTIIMEGKVKAE